MILRNTGYGERIRRFRNKMGYSQEILAEKLDVTGSTVGRWERGIHAPKKKAFKLISDLFEKEGLTYEDLNEEDLDSLRLQQLRLLQVMRDNDYEAIKKEKAKFEEMMEGDDIVTGQYSGLANLILKIGDKSISMKEFIIGCAKIFELDDDMPPFENIQNTNLTQIEYLILFKMAEAYIVVGELDKAKYILSGIYISLHERVERNQFFKEHVVACATFLAEIYVKCEYYTEAEKCLDYVFEVSRDNFAMRTFIQGLQTMERLCHSLSRENMAKSINNFLAATHDLFSCINDDATSSES